MCGMHEIRGRFVEHADALAIERDALVPFEHGTTTTMDGVSASDGGRNMLDFVPSGLTFFEFSTVLVQSLDEEAAQEKRLELLRFGLFHGFFHLVETVGREMIGGQCVTIEDAS